MEQEFAEYLKSKKIDPEGFQSNEPDTFEDFEKQFLQLHPKSFTMQKLFYINVLRRKYLLKVADVKNSGTAKARPRPVMKKDTGTSDKKKLINPKLKPKVAKPKTGSAAGSDEEKKLSAGKKPVVKPNLSRPVVKDRGDLKEDVKAKKPVIKPRIPQKKAEELNKNSDQEKPKAKKPVIKPRIPKRKKED